MSLIFLSQLPNFKRQGQKMGKFSRCVFERIEDATICFQDHQNQHLLTLKALVLFWPFLEIFGIFWTYNISKGCEQHKG